MLASLLLLLGLILLVFGAEGLVRGASGLGRRAGLTPSVIGLTIVATGTSLPELATSLVAALRREADIAVGNVVGSNIFNVLAILGAAALARPLAVDGIAAIDLLVMVLLSFALLLFMRTGLKIRRLEGALLLATYGGYLLFLWPTTS